MRLCGAVKQENMIKRRGDENKREKSIGANVELRRKKERERERIFARRKNSINEMVIGYYCPSINKISV